MTTFSAWVWPEPEPEPDPEPEPGPEPDVDLEPEADINPEPEPDAEPDPEPEREPEPEAEPERAKLESGLSLDPVQSGLYAWRCPQKDFNTRAHRRAPSREVGLELGHGAEVRVRGDGLHCLESVVHEVQLGDRLRRSSAARPQT